MVRWSLKKNKQDSNVTISLTLTPAELTWRSSKPLDKFAQWVLGSSAHIESSDVSRRSGLSCFHHRPYRNQRQRRQTGMLGIQWLVWFTDPDCVFVALCRLVGAWGRWRNDDGEVDLFDLGSSLRCIRQRRGAIWSQCHSLENKRAENVKFTCTFT